MTARPDRIRSPLRGILPELDTNERALRAYHYATTHDLQIRDLTERMDKLEQNLQKLANFVGNLAGHRRAYLE